MANNDAYGRSQGPAIPPYEKQTEQNQIRPDRPEGIGETAENEGQQRSSLPVIYDIENIDKAF